MDTPRLQRLSPVGYRLVDGILWPDWPDAVERADHTDVICNIDEVPMPIRPLRQNVDDD